MEVGIRELKAKLSSYVARVQRGESVVVTARGRPVARLEGLEPAEPPEAVRALVEAGRLVYKGRFRAGALGAPLELIGEGKDSTDYVREGRR
jgi:prevent-host-death family protein